MPSFQESFPERSAAAPTLTGEASLPTNLITPRLRRQQLVNLARAYNIPINPEARKDQILPTLVGAEQQGVFRGQASDPEALQMALKDPDVREPEPYMPPVIPPEVTPEPEKPLPNNPLLLMKQTCKRLGINSGSMTLGEMADAINKHYNGQAESDAGGKGPAAEQPDVADGGKAGFS